MKFKTRPRRAPCVLLLMIVFCGGCSFEKFAADNMAPVLAKTNASFNRGRVPRAAREAAPGLLATLEGLIAASPDNEELLLLKAELNAGFAFAMIEEEYRRAERAYEETEAAELKTWARELYRTARAAGRHALEQHASGLPGRVEAVDASEITPLLHRELSPDALPALFWWAFSWGAQINLDVDLGAKVTKDLPRVRALMTWALETDESYFNGGPHLFFAMLNLAVGKSLGGRPDEAVAHLEAVDRLTGGRNLMSKVIYAEHYLPQTQTPDDPKATVADRARASLTAWSRYMKTLQEVRDAPEDLWPEQGLLNALAKRRAEDLYYRAEDVLIPPPGVEIPRREGDEDDDEDEDEDEDED